MRVDPGAGESISTQLEISERASAERAIAFGLLTIRALHIVQGIVAVAAGWKAYRRPRLALGLLLASAGEAAWLLKRAWASRSFSDPRLAWFDAGFGMAGLCLIGTTIEPEDRTAWLNWMCPLTYGTTAAATVALEGGNSAKVPALLAATYLATVRGNVRSGGSQLATAFANTTGYAGFYLASRRFGGRLRSDAEKLERARNETLMERERLAAERQRNQEHRLLHDSALQTLELIASNENLDSEMVRRQARKEAALLRRAISGEKAESAGLIGGVHELVDSYARDGLRVDLALVDDHFDTSPAVDEALIGALRESLTNVAKHSGVHTVVVNLSLSDGGVRMIVRDRGKGFDQLVTSTGFGTRNSIAARLEEIGGTATINSTPGSGTKVTLWAPI
jgi:signal transduction histidine kinase